MKKINNKIISIPPFISTSWSHVSALHMKGNTLIVTLSEGEVIQVPDLDVKTIELIFAAHTDYLEQEMNNSLSNKLSNPNSKLLSPFSTSFASSDQLDAPLRIGFGTLDGLSSAAMQHNPAQADAPDLPPQILQKISAISKIVSPEEIVNLPKAEPHCNCFHCQISRAIQQSINNSGNDNIELAAGEEEVTDTDLAFKQWNVIQTGEQLFTVINPLDEQEKYNVYLGQPLGCTCGKQGCEHIVAVLKS